MRESTDRDRLPMVRPRRLRRTARLRDWVAEHRLSAGQLVYPLFVRDGDGEPEPIPSLPGVHHHAIGRVGAVAEAVLNRGVSAVLLFGVSRHKTADGREAYADTSIVSRAIREIRAHVPELIILTDVCLCSYTRHGHCGVLRGKDVDNDRTVELLGRMSVAHARAGADLVAPSAMMDHQVAGIRAALDSEGFGEVGILAYAAKFASAFYGPFRDAGDSAPAFGDRRTYQLDVRNSREAEREIELDVREGADIVMIKPALPCLDVIARARSRISLPIAAYQVSGEYVMIKAAAAKGWVNERDAVMECLRAIYRAGADLIVTYSALDYAGWTGASGKP